MSIAHSEREHALLSASASHRWLHCTPSSRLEETLPDTESQAAKEGTLAHEIAELKLRKQFIEPMGTRSFNSKLKKMQAKPLYDSEMLKHTDTYKDYLSELVHSYKCAPYIAVEKKIDYSSFAPEGFGTVDCLMIIGETMYISDFKYGKGVPVSAYDNPQLKLYALGAYVEYSFLYPIKNIQLAIVQPRLNNISEYTLSAEELLAWGESIKPIAQTAFAGKGEFIPGEHCRFCRAKALCRAQLEQYTALEDFKQMKPPLISNEEVGQILKTGKNLAAWVKALEEYALSESLKGTEILGWKAVEGRGSRQFIDQDVAFKALTEGGIEEVMLYERKPLTVPAVEKLLGKAKYKELLANHVIVNPGKPTLVEFSDSREAISRPSASDDFKTKEELSNE
ncbi:DUF2800 domain-containing protein [Brevibacillus sp. 7WMA2]|uniref:DUF2800 domain-containing protein n=1 Tax=Brevibacillus sp. 7WMA2 TaxID=2683193 RepID=UPI0013A738E0|nr:DUF2800 domain-containing protein [Brevibacillus sp. 7WMA2]QIC08181.1 DUF2800 domain-containing protein [Brevibacillus sp. 7WMA2]